MSLKILVLLEFFFLPFLGAFWGSFLVWSRLLEGKSKLIILIEWYLVWLWMSQKTVREPSDQCFFQVFSFLKEVSEETKLISNQTYFHCLGSKTNLLLAFVSDQILLQIQHKIPLEKTTTCEVKYLKPMQGTRPCWNLKHFRLKASGSANPAGQWKDGFRSKHLRAVAKCHPGRSRSFRWKSRALQAIISRTLQKDRCIFEKVFLVLQNSKKTSAAELAIALLRATAEVFWDHLSFRRGKFT